MSTGQILFYPKFKGETAEGVALSGGLLYTYEPGTTTPKATYSDSALNTEHTNPIVLDSNGEAVVWLDGQYDLTLRDSAGNLQWTMTDVFSSYLVTDFAKTFLDDLNASAVLTTLGFSTFAKTLIDDADAAAVRVTIGLSTTAKPQYLGLTDGTYDYLLPTNNPGNSVLMTGNASTIAWFYLNTAPPGWKVLSTGADTVLAVAGGSQAYNVNGGNAGGTWTQPDHTLTTDELAAHSHSITSSGTYLVTTPTGADGTIDGSSAVTGYDRNVATFSINNAGGGSAHNHGTTYRPSASVGKLFQLNTA